MKLLLIMVISCFMLAHSGRTNSSGCHAGSRPYHCHGGGGSTGSRGAHVNMCDVALAAIVVLGGIAGTLWVGGYLIASLV